MTGSQLLKAIYAPGHNYKWNCPLFYAPGHNYRMELSTFLESIYALRYGVCLHPWIQFKFPGSIDQPGLKCHAVICLDNALITIILFYSFYSLQSATYIHQIYISVCTYIHQLCVSQHTKVTYMFGSQSKPSLF